MLPLVLHAAVSAWAGGQCTIAYAMGNAVDDDRPILWRNYDWQDSPHATQVLYQQTNAYLAEWGPLAWIATSQEEWFVFGGLNEKGVGCFNTLIEEFSVEGEYDYGNYRIQAWILGNAESVADVRTAIDEQVRFWTGAPGGVDHDWSYPSAGGGFYPAMTLAVVDALGNASLFEISRDFWFEYDPSNPARLEQFPVQVGVRANKPHRREDHRDNEGESWAATGGRRYVEARENLTAVATDGDGVRLQELMDLISRHGEPGFEPAAYDVLPLDEEGEYQNSNWKNQDGSILWGAAPGEDPRAATFLLAPGPPDYSCYVPLWVAAGDSLSPRVTQLDATSIVHHVWGIFEGRVDTEYDDYVHGLFANMEDNHRRAAQLARTLWAEAGFDAAIADAISDEAAENLFLAAEAMNAASGYDLPVPPTLTSIDVAWANGVGSFSATAMDDGEIVAWEWDFGDGATASEAAPQHAFTTTDKVLVRVRATDDEGLRNARWALLEPGGEIDRGTTSTSTAGGETAGDSGADDGDADAGESSATSGPTSGSDDGAPAGDTAVSQDGTGAPGSDSPTVDRGCGCRHSGAPHGWWLWPAIGIASRRRRSPPMRAVKRSGRAPN
jgi:hypothetical protein